MGNLFISCLKKNVRENNQDQEIYYHTKKLKQQEWSDILKI